MKHIQIFEAFNKHQGDCFEVHGRFMSIGISDYRDDINVIQLPGMMLAHGVAINEADNLPFSHCWIELDNLVFDFSNDRDLKINKSTYYTKGKIDPKTVILYTAEQVMDKILKTHNWGPWDEFYKLNKDVNR